MAEPVPIEEEDFARGETERESRKIEARAVSLSAALLAYLKVKRRRLIRDMVKEIKETGKIKKVRKANGPEQERLIKLLSYYGLKQIDDSGKEMMGSEWKIPDPFIADYLERKKGMIRGLDSRIEREFQRAVGKALFKWLQETPTPNTDVIARRIQRLLEVKSQKEAPKDLKALGDRFTEDGLLARSRMIARTEIKSAEWVSRLRIPKQDQNFCTQATLGLKVDSKEAAKCYEASTVPLGRLLIADAVSVPYRHKWQQG
jgi:hypothetical protein